MRVGDISVCLLLRSRCIRCLRCRCCGSSLRQSWRRPNDWFVSLLLCCCRSGYPLLTSFCGRSHCIWYRRSNDDVASLSCCWRKPRTDSGRLFHLWNSSGRYFLDGRLNGLSNKAYVITGWCSGIFRCRRRRKEVRAIDFCVCVTER